MKQRPLLPLADYQRIYQVIYSVLEATGIARTHRACIVFASAGMMILREHYKLEASLSVGSMALMVGEKAANVAVYGREIDGEWVYDANGFHAWVECDGWLIDFMAPIMARALKEDGAPFDVPRKMLQKPLAERKDHPRAIQHEGEFFAFSDAALAEQLLDTQTVQFEDILNVCLAWFRKPPRPLPPLSLGATGLDPKPLVLHAPAIIGSW